MNKTLIIAEKPSVAVDIAKTLKGFSKKGDFYESEQYVLSAAVGHLLEICPPENCEVKRGKWKLENLPVIPPAFDLRPISKSESRLKLLLRLIRRKDVHALINACDAGREGELIFRYLVQFARTSKPIRRLWLQSMTTGAIRDGFTALREDAEMQPLAAAAVCRSEADWLVGINSTRAMTAFNSKLGGFHLTTVGRVQTPTLAIVVERDEAIRKFIPRDYWEVQAAFQAAAGTYTGRWFDESFVKDKNGDSALKSERLWESPRADAIRDRCLGKPGIVTEESKPTTQMSPLLFDLTSLQREGNSRFGFPARRTLQLAQALYERHKVLTYPRTDARALPEDYIGTVTKTLKALAATHQYGPLVPPVLQQGWVRPNKRIFNNAKISDHFAIIPTAIMPQTLRDDERKIYDLVTRRFLAVFYPAAEFLVTVRITRVEQEPFKSEGKVLVAPGWMAVYGKESRVDATPRLVPIQSGESVQTIGVDLVAEKTRPPARFTEATLLSAMEGAGKLVEDEELRAAMSVKGLGTPATRAAIIEGLIYELYIVRNGRELRPTAKAFSLMTLLRGLDIPALCSPELTGDWEYKLKQMERNQLQRPDFMREIIDITRQIVEKAKRYEHDTVPGVFGVLKVPCPKCGGVINENYKKFQCQACDFGVWKTLAGRQFELEEMETLISKRSLGPLEHFRSHKGKTFTARVIMTPELKIEFDFGQSRDETSAPVDFSGQEPVGVCRVCGARVFENGLYYVCEKSVGPSPACKFRSGTIILQQIVDRTQMAKLLATGKTDLLTKFISKKGRPFRAFMAYQDGKVVFEFIKSAKAKTDAAKAAQVAATERSAHDPRRAGVTGNPPKAIQQ